MNIDVISKIFIDVKAAKVKLMVNINTFLKLSLKLLLKFAVFINDNLIDFVVDNKILVEWSRMRIRLMLG